MQGALLYAIAIGICAGIALGLLAAPPLYGAAAVLCIAACAAYFGWRHARALIVVAALCAAVIGIVRTEFFRYALLQETVPQYIGGMAVVRGTVDGDIDRRDFAARVVIRVSHINAKPASGTVLAELPRDAEVFHGGLIEARGMLEAPENFETNGGRIFDYENYLRARGITALMRHATLRSFEPRAAARGYLFAIKHAFKDSLERVFSEPRAALLEGLLLGERRGLSEELMNAFVVSGLIHVVVLSGYNISLVVLCLLAMLSFLPKRLALAAGSAAVVLFALMVGGGAATLRAVIMAQIAILARYLNRPAAALRALAAAGAAMALWNPPIIFDAGFVLSILATFGLITLSPSFERRFARVPKRFKLREIAASTTAVQLFVLPALLYFTGTLSLSAFPANVLALPAVSYAMLLGFVASMLGFLHPHIALLPALAADLLLRWMIAVATFAASVPYGAFIVPAFPAWVAFLAYIPLTVLAVRMYQKKLHARTGRFELTAGASRSAPLSRSS